jgi:protoporphyrinogen oxidase
MTIREGTRATSDRDVDVAILGAGLAGLSTSYHLGHPSKTVIFEAKNHYGGHVYSEEQDGFWWDDGPHISFTMNKYILDLFAEFVDGEYEKVDIKATNYYQGNWIDHPAQTSLWQIPEPLRTRCLESFVETVNTQHDRPKNYEQWLHQAMGPVFADTFPAAYTRKYWTCEPRDLDIDWIGQRVMRPKFEDVVNSAKGPLPRGMYYVNDRSPRYPSKGGFLSYCHKMAKDADIRYGMKLVQVDFGKRILRFNDGSEVRYGRLVTTIPLPVLLLQCATDVPDDVKQAASLLRSSQFYRVDVAVNHPRLRDEIWYYIYDEDKLGTRLSVMERFSPNNAPPGKTAIQVEVYGSVFKPLPADMEKVRATVVDELLEMGLIANREAIAYVNCVLVPTGQIIYDLNRRDVLRQVNQFLDKHGVLRVGRYSEWKYLMSDGCVLGGRRVARQLKEMHDDTDWSGVAITDSDVPDDLIGKVSSEPKVTQ